MKPIKPVKFKIHSTVDVITNSSSTIYTYSDGSIDPAKEMINEFLKVFGIDKTCDDLFYINVFCNIDMYSDVAGDREEFINKMNYKEEKNYFNSIIADVLHKKIERPNWMKEVDEEEESETFIYIEAKEEKYKEVAKKIKEFLYSTEHEEGAC